ncbi:UNVERIFIED_CONTAM: SEC14 cytosolic factor [Sesamum calycinum]|uniref:SEC14 cytosolic factor n=1 Tax=Sesamum calycinum TaxID=2727403 RepID=A0AAW2Q5R4_9LAMI
MAVVPQEAIDQFEALMEEEVDESLKRTFQNIHQGYPCETLMRFLKAREGNVTKAHKMLVDCLNWRVQNDIDDMLAKPIVPVELYRAIRDSQLIGLSGYTNEGLPVFAVGVGLSTFDRASLMTIISSIDDLNYPEKTLTYYIVNAPYVFSACWKVVKPLLQERTRRKINVLSGCGQDDLLKQVLVRNPVEPVKQGSVHVTLPEDADEGDIAKILESELEKFEDLQRCPESLKDLKINDDKC